MRACYGEDIPRDFSLRSFESRLAAHNPAAVSAIRRAAVAVVLRPSHESVDVLLMKRAQREGDRWSGQVSFPGGREEREDASLLDTAVRETHEELGIDLAECARPLGQIDMVRAVARAKILPMSISPYVFAETDPAPLHLGPEAEQAFWLPLKRAANGELDGTYQYGIGPASLSLPCWNYEGYTIWGLTYRMLNNLIRLAR